MATLRWLHLTDLHVGMPEMKTSWPAVEAHLLPDLERTQRWVGGAFDVVLFSGDLTNKGTAPEYEQLDTRLDKIWAHLSKNASEEPVLLVVPGNHDLVRPEPHLAATRELLRWSEDVETARLFWDEKKGVEYREVVIKAFEPYVRWLERWRKRHPLPSWVEINERGIIPGDFAASIRRDGLSIGIAGLNSAFLHLNGRVKPGSLALDPRQLHELFDGNTNDWAKRHDVGLLMTHHPPEWLSDAALSAYKADLLLPEWFAAHICGHLHEAESDVRSIGGADPLRVYRGTSLFGLEEWETSEGKGVARLFGYAAGKIERKDDRVFMRLWPRRAERGPMDRYRFVADNRRFDLDEDANSSVEWDLGGRRSCLSSVSPALPALSPPSKLPHAPGGGYDPAWYIPPPKDPESMALPALAQRGVPVLLTAAPMFGKSTVLGRLVAVLREQDRDKRARGLVVTLNLSMLTDPALDDTTQCMREIGELLVEQFARALTEMGDSVPDMAGWVDEAWKRPGTPERRLRHLLEQRILSLPYVRVVFALDCFERLFERQSELAVARLLRTFGEDGREHSPWAKVRLIIAATGSSLALNSRVDEVSDLFNATVRVHLEPFGIPELNKLKDLYNVDWSAEDLQHLLHLTGGWPHITCYIFYLAATGTPKEQLLSLDTLRNEHCAFLLKRLWLHVQSHERLGQLVCAMVKGAQLEPQARQVLREAGLIRRDENDEKRYVISSELLRSYFEERC